MQWQAIVKSGGVVILNLTCPQRQAPYTGSFGACMAFLLVSSVGANIQKQFAMAEARLDRRINLEFYRSVTIPVRFEGSMNGINWQFRSLKGRDRCAVIVNVSDTDEKKPIMVLSQEPHFMTDTFSLQRLDSFIDVTKDIGDPSTDGFFHTRQVDFLCSVSH